MWQKHRHTYRHKDHATCDFCRNRPHLCYTCTRTTCSKVPCTYLALPVIYIALLFVILKQQKFNKSSWHMGSRPNLNLNPNQRAFRPMWHTQFCRATLSHNFSTHAFITRQNCSMQLCMSHTATLSHKQELTNRRSATKLHRIEHCSIRKGVVQLLKSCAKNRRCDILS